MPAAARRIDSGVFVALLSQPAIEAAAPLLDRQFQSGLDDVSFVIVKAVHFAVEGFAADSAADNVDQPFAAVRSRRLCSRCRLLGN